MYDVLRSALTDADFDVVIVKDGTGQRWVVKAPKMAAAGAAMEAEMGLLRVLSRAHEAGLIAFDVPRPVGAAIISGEEPSKAVVYTEVRGSSLSLAGVEPGPGLAESIGRTLAQIHELSPSIVEEQGLPTYSAQEYRERRLAELDAGIHTGLVPARLADRWERQLENVAWWRFEPTVTHGDMGEHQLVVSEGIVAGVVDWMDAKVADPADDLAWLAAAAPDDVFESVFEAYTMGRRELRDPHLADRARLASELALLRWLMFGVRTDDAAIIADGRAMLADLEALLFA